MNLHPLAEPLPAPNVCFLCEQKPRATGWIDTQRLWNVGVITRLDGHKLVCPDCANEIAGLVDNPNGEDLERANARLQHLLDNALDRLEQIGAVVAS